MKTVFLFILMALSVCAPAQTYPQNYFRSPLDIPMQLVANFGELRANHWHMGLDIRTQQRENLPVHAAADGYIAAVSVDANGFGRAIYIKHPNGYTTLYAHLNNFEPKLNAWLQQQQYRAESWSGKWMVPEGLFPVKQHDFIAYSGTTGGSQGPHVHFEIRDTETDKCLNPLLFHFPIPDAVPPSLLRLAVYDRTRTTYAQRPKIYVLSHSGASYTTAPAVLASAAPQVSFAIGAVDRFTGYANPNGIYSAQLFMDDMFQSGFVLDGISYSDTRYLNAQIDYPYKAAGGPYLQHIAPLPGDGSGVYSPAGKSGIITLTDEAAHSVRIEVRDAAGNLSTLRFQLRWTPAESQQPYTPAAGQLLPGEVNVFERPGFEAYTTAYAVYDTVNCTYAETANTAAGAASPMHSFISSTIPVHDSVMVRLKVPDNLTTAQRDRLIMVSHAGSRAVVEKANFRLGWASSKFRQFGTYQAFIDSVPPTVNAPGAGDTVDLRRAARLVFYPKDNFEAIKSLRATLDGQWLLLTNDKGSAFIYKFDDYFLPGVHRLTLAVTDMAGNETERIFWVRR